MPDFTSSLAACCRLGVMAALLLALGGCGERSVEALTEAALNGLASEQEKATQELSERGPAAVSSLRRILAESKSPAVQAVAIQALGAFGDLHSMPAFLAAMDDADPQVRSRAGVAATKILGTDYRFRTEDPPAKRKAIIEQMHEAYDQLVVRRVVK